MSQVGQASLVAQVASAPFRCPSALTPDRVPRDPLSVLATPDNPYSKPCRRKAHFLQNAVASTARAVHGGSHTGGAIA